MASSSSSSSSSPSSSCLTCFSAIPTASLPKCIVHSCCGRPVCAGCLVSMPRLATFCPFCEDVMHAFRKGPRDDVIRAGQTIFDAETVKSFSSQGQDAGSGDDINPPPAYVERDEGIRTPILDSAPNDGKFVIDDADNAEEEDRDERPLRDESTRTPRLLQPSRTGEKKGPAEMGVDRKQAATSAQSSADSASSPSYPTSDSLLQALSIGNGRSPSSSQRHTATTEKNNVGSDPPGPSTFVERNREEQADHNGGLTRQYWLRPSDTLISLSLRFKANAAALCKLNDLPLSTATTTPHLIHTRQFLLIPEGAVQSALSSGGQDSPALLSALDGPVAQSRQQKIQRARREAESRFRAIITKNETIKKGKGRAIENGDVTLCDDRAARAYISLMEEELRFVDFGDGGHFENVGRDSKERERFDEDRTEEHDASVEAGRRERYNMIVKQAICRWEMDSDWERRQRSMGITPVEVVGGASAQNPSRIHQPSSSCQRSGWLQRWMSPAAPFNSTLNWPEKSR